LNVLLIGSGAREHALAWKLRQSPGLTDLFVAQGNPGTATLGTNLDLAPSDQDGLVRTCRELKVDLVFVGNEEPLAAGLIDRLAVEGIAAFGPTKAAAEIEWSKAFAKRLMADNDIPTAPFQVFDDIGAARAFVAEQEVPLVVKADGLALGKGVVVTTTQEQALEAVEAAMSQEAFGASGARVVIEERLSGREVSAHAFTDGRTVRHMPFSCDHKPVLNDDKGPNTGGMGAYSPAGWLDSAAADAIRDKVTEAAISAMSQVGRPYRGVLYPGIMITDQGPMVIEFNSRFGDPETQVLLPRMESDLLQVMWSTVNQRLHEVEVTWSEQACIAIVLASGGYPGDYRKGLAVEGLDDLDDAVLAFHAGTATDDRGALVTAGGRVVTITALGATLEEAREIAYRNVERVKFEGAYYRTDIGAAASPKTLAGADKR
jgi:phosphoribosylamine--glycine ligase